MQLNSLSIMFYIAYDTLSESNWCSVFQNAPPKIKEARKRLAAACVSQDDPGASDCQKSCTDEDWCVGYSYGKGNAQVDHKNICVLYPNIASCPNEWAYVGDPRNEHYGYSVAQSASTLRGEGDRGGNCFASKGKISKFKRFCNNLN